jgi:hypothetical protein
MTWALFNPFNISSRQFCIAIYKKGGETGRARDC